MSKKSIDFGQSGLLAFWESMSVDERETLVKNLEAFHALISSLKGRGIIDTDKHLSEITILKQTPETKELIKLRDAVHAQGVRIIYKGKMIVSKDEKKKK